MRYAIVENGIVVNVIVAEQDFIDENYPDAIPLSDEDRAGLSYTYENGKFIEPEIIVPTVIDAEVVEPTKALDAPTE